MLLNVSVNTVSGFYYKFATGFFKSWLFFGPTILAKKESLRGVEFWLPFFCCVRCACSMTLRWFRWRRSQVRPIQIFTRQKLNTNIEDHALERAIRYLLSSSYGSYLC